MFFLVKTLKEEAVSSYSDIFNLSFLKRDSKYLLLYCNCMTSSLLFTTSDPFSDLLLENTRLILLSICLCLIFLS